MALVQRLDIRQGQALVMTPQLQQAIKLLQLSNVELTAYVQSQIEQNQLLEGEEGRGDEGSGEEKVRDNADPAGSDEAEAGSGPAESAHEDAVEAWHEVAGSDGEGNLDYAGDPDAWRSRNNGSGSDDLPGI